MLRYVYTLHPLTVTTYTTQQCTFTFLSYARKGQTYDPTLTAWLAPGSLQ